MEIAVIWLVCGIIAAVIGARKGSGCFGFFLGILLGPLGIIAALVTKGNRKPCPYCKELMHHDAVVCPHCHRDVPKPDKPKGFMEGLRKGMED